MAMLTCRGAAATVGQPQDRQKAHLASHSPWKVSAGAFMQSKGSSRFARFNFCVRARVLEIGRENTKVKKHHVAKIRDILKALQAQPDVHSIMQPWQGKLQPKEECIILSEQQDWKVAMDLFSWFSSRADYIPNVYRFNIMFKVLGKHQKWDLLNKLWSRMSLDGVRATNVTFSTLINAYTKARLINQAIACFEAMLKENMKPDEITLNTMVNLYKLSGMYNEAERFSKKFLFIPGDARAADCNQPLNVETYNTLIDMYGKSGRLADATCTFEEMMSRGITPNTVTFNTMMHICGTHDRMEEAEALFEKMEEEKCEPDVGTYSILIALHIKAANIQAAQHAFARMKSSSILPNAVTYRTLIIGYSTQGLVAQAENLIEEMEEDGFLLDETVIVHLTQMYIEAGNDAKASYYFDRLKLCRGLDGNHLLPLIDAYAQRGSWKEAEHIFSCASNLDIPSCTLLYNVMIKAYRLGKMYQKAFKLFESMREAGVETDVATYNTMILTACDAGEIRKASILLSDMKMAGYKPNSPSYTAIVVAYGKEKLVEKAKEFFKEMETHSMVDMIAYSAMLNVYANAGMLKETEATLHAMEIAGHVPNCTVYTSVMKLYGKLDLVEQAERMFKRIESLEGGPDIYAKNTLLDIYCKAGLRKVTWNYFQRMQQEGHVNEISCNIILTTLANESGWHEEALVVANKMLDSRFVTGVLSFNNVMGVFAGNGKQQEAFELFKQMIKQEIMPDFRTYDRLKDILENPGLLREAIEELGLARKEDTLNSIHRFVALTSLYSLAGIPLQAMEACTKVIDSGEGFSLPACNAILNAYGSNAQFDVAVRLFMDMQSKGPKPNTVSFTSMLLLYGKEGLVEGVTRLFSRMKQEDCPPDEATFKALIKTYKRAGRFDLVSMATHEMKFVRFLKENQGTLLLEGESDASEEEEAV